MPDAQTKQPTFPTTLLEAITHFADPDTALAYVAQMRWGDLGPQCPRCKSRSHYFIKSRRLWQCRECRKQYSVKQGTILEDSQLSLDKWLAGIWLIVNAKNGVSSYEVSRSLGITQKSAWHMMHRIRFLLHTGSIEKLSGHVEADETYIGGKARNMHEGKRKEKVKGRGRGENGKTIVMGLLERKGRVHVKVVPNVKRETLQAEVRQHVEPGSNLYTDALKSYRGLDSDYAHKVVDHAEKYVDGIVYTNGLENFWSLLKRTIRGTYVSVEPHHLFRYLDEQAHRFNTRKESDGERFAGVVKQTSGKRLTYRALTGKGDERGQQTGEERGVQTLRGSSQESHEHPEA